MIFNIRRLILFFISILVLVFYSIFAYYFFKQEENLAKVILKTINSNITETSYTLSKNLKSKDDVLLYRALLDRISANNNFIAAIAILDDDKLLLVSDPSYQKIDNVPMIKESSYYKELMNNKYIETDIRFFENKEIRKLRLVYILEQEELALHFIDNKINFLIYFGLLPIIAFSLLLILLKKYVSNPLEQLRQYAYYNNDVPKAFKVKELESIRYSMVDTFSRLESEKKELYLMARTDSLSGLSNRNSLNEYLERLILTSKRNKKEFAFLYLDIDYFKSINDSLGHNIGDELLQNISKLLKRILRPSDFIARIGGDEFVILIQDYDSYLELSKVINRVQKQLSKNWVIKTNPINISCSIGIAFYPKDGQDSVSLMKNADIAMYQAKKLGRNQYHFYTAYNGVFEQCFQKYLNTFCKNIF